MPVLSKTAQVEQRLRRSILCGEWAPGTHLPGERDMLSLFGVSRTTLRDALTSLASQGLIERKQKSGTYVSTALGTTTVAIVANADLLTASTSYYFRRLVQEARRLIRESGRRPVAAYGHGNTLQACLDSIDVLTRPAEGKLLGVLSTMPLGSAAERLKEAGISAVDIGAGLPVGKHSVIFDYARLTEMGAQRLLSAGYADFAVMCVHPASGETDMEANGLGEMLLHLQEKAVDFRADRLIPVPGSYDLKQTYHIFKQVWASAKRPRAIFFCDDGICDVATRAILELGIKVPEELAIVTHANKGRTFHFPVPLTCVEFDPAAAVRAAWGMLEKLMTGERVDDPVVRIPPHWREGKSV